MGTLFLLGIILPEIILAEGLPGFFLEQVQVGGPLDYAISVIGRSNSSLLRCASLCELERECVSIAVCADSYLHTSTCALLTLDVNYDNTFGQDVTNCNVLFSRQRFENVLSCTGLPPIDTVLVPCTTTPQPSTTPCVTFLGGGCLCPLGATNLACTQFISDCEQVGYQSSDVYNIQPENSPAPFQVYCHSDEVVIQQRTDCTALFFNRSWVEYRNGFGNVSDDCFWLGNEKIRLIAEQDTYRLRIRPSGSYSSKYNDFKLGTEAERYRMLYSEFAETYNRGHDGFGDCSEDQRLLGMDFYTSDSDNSAGCATDRKSGWWYNSACAFGDLNQFDVAEWPNSEDGTLTSYTNVQMTLERYSGYHG